MRDLLIEILSTVRKNKLRTALTGFAVSWGIFMLIVLLGAGNGLLNATKSNSMDIMANSMMVGGGRTSMPYNGLKKGRFVQLRQSDIDITGGKEFADNIDDVTGLVEYSVNISNLKESVSCSLRGVYPAYGKIEKIKISHGRFINDIDLAERRKVVVLGRKIADELLNDPSIPTENIVGQYVNIEKINYKVVGIYASDQMRRDAAYMPFSSMLTLYGLGDKVHNIIFSFNNLNTAEANKQFEKKYRAVINTNHRAAPADPNTIWIWNRFTQNLQMQQGTAMISITIWIIGIFTLLSGIVGVSNIMLISVKERTHEFGIRKALGAKPSSILGLIIVESVAITAFFGYIGMVFGMGACEILDIAFGKDLIDIGVAKISMIKEPFIGVNVALEATLLLIVAGTLAGLVPAKKAAGVRPIEALRAE